ncbi:hypothetical protein BH23VER1_BH23VER1_12530 [soil metagenome]
MPKITLNHADGSENRYALEGGLFTVGRAPETAITLSDDASSSYHAVLKRLESGDFAVIDLGSTNPTRVNGTRIAEPYPLQNGDRLLFGDTLAVYESDIPARPRTPHAASRPDSPPQPKGRSVWSRESRDRRRPARESARPGASPDPPAEPSATPPPPAASCGGCLGLLVATALLVCLLLGTSLAARMAQG